jgi:hypothetical protein
LQSDRDRYRDESPAIGNPDLVIVSGDLIRGISPESPDPVKELGCQYEQAEDFLVRLADSFVNGDRERIIIVPGNHDVSFYHVVHSLRRLSIDPTHPRTIQFIDGYVQQLCTPDSRLRWSWKDLCFYEITNNDMYLARLDAFCSFYARFYQSNRTYSLEPHQQYDIFDYPRWGITVAGFSSCHGNDPFNKRGAIHPDSMAEAASRLREGQYADRLLMAVWHHNTSGGPMQSDYIDSDILQVLIDNGFSLGFHGHRHRSQFIEEKFQFGVNRKITVISAGTLCAGPGGIPAGHTRAYNLIHIDTSSYAAKLHLRQMLNESLDNPIWGQGHFMSSGKSFVEFDIQKPTRRGTSKTTASVLGDGEALIRSKQYARAILILRPLARENLLARRLLLECYVGIDDTKNISNEFYPPLTAGEIVYVADALWSEKRVDTLRELLASDIVCKASDPAVVEVKRRYQERIKE